jgi:hypothetical protein
MKLFAGIATGDRSTIVNPCKAANFDTTPVSRRPHWRKKEGGRRKKEGGRRKEEGRRKKEEGRSDHRVMKASVPGLGARCQCRVPV